jgi:hypothetical protein
MRQRSPLIVMRATPDKYFQLPQEEYELKTDGDFEPKRFVREGNPIRFRWAFTCNIEMFVLRVDPLKLKIRRLRRDLSRHVHPWVVRFHFSSSGRLELVAFLFAF